MANIDNDRNNNQKSSVQGIFQESELSFSVLNFRVCLLEKIIISVCNHKSECKSLGFRVKTLENSPFASQQCFRFHGQASQTSFQKCEMGLEHLFDNLNKIVWREDQLK